MSKGKKMGLGGVGGENQAKTQYLESSLMNQALVN